MKARLYQLFHQLDATLVAEVAERRRQGSLGPVLPIEVRIVGQTALLLGELTIPISGTLDVDAIFPSEYWFTTQFREALFREGLLLEPDRHLIWMPEQTTYHTFYKGAALVVHVADAIFVMASKCKFHRERDRQLLALYFAAYAGSQEKVERMGIDTAWARS